MNLSMSTKIDLTDYGIYKGPRGHVYGSRVLDGSVRGDFTVSRINFYWWYCKRAGHTNHKVLAVIFDGDLYANCDCYDFHRYGKVFGRACIHIWRLYLYEDIFEV